MCGFAAMIGSNGAPADSRIVQRMTEVIRHRGPDGEGAYTDGPVGLGFRRLAILDLKPTGHQPMVSEDGNLVLVFNGEIYNFVELRDELRSIGHRFRSTGDTEVLLRAYLQWGPDCLQRLNGMWAFLLYDKRRRILVGSRDRFGKKPLYYHQSGPYCFIGSEIKAIVASGFHRGGIDWGKASRFLLSDGLERLPEDQNTFHAGIRQLPAGSAFELDLTGRMRTWRYWSLEDVPSVGSEMTDPARAWGDLFEDSVRLRLRSDVPVGIFLSGGLDSTSIACSVSHLRERTGGTSGEFLAFSFESTEHDESQYLRDTLNQTGIELVSLQPDPRNLLANLERCLWFQDEPVHSLVALITFELSHLAAERGVKVILNGGGADEYLAGYRTFFPSYWTTLLEERGVQAAQREIEAYCRIVPGDPRALLHSVRRARFLGRMGRHAIYRKLAAWLRRRRFRRHAWFTPALFDALPAEDATFLDMDLDSVLKRSVERAPLPLYLRIEDRNSMAHSVEARMPFLDHRLVRRAFELPIEWKMREAWNKYLLRESMRERIPESVRTRVDKMGFPVPSRTWFAEHLFEQILDTVHGNEFRDRGIYAVRAIEEDIAAHRQGKIDVSRRLFDLIQFEIWVKQREEPVRYGLGGGAAGAPKIQAPTP